MTYTCDDETFDSIDAIKHHLMTKYGHPKERLRHLPKMADDQAPEQSWLVGIVRHIEVPYEDGSSKK
ncbi:MAG: CBS domain-containing protein [Gammaproteobacteria bacterium]|nr:hypothetical protein [Gammaproteobacteria bacterium]MXX94127.1 CBS domain-containing protein [Gammaproteobacteria bacterium]MYK44238.1 CBS domain-containing protein [Gammaproteobacteria bacterium]